MNTFVRLRPTVLALFSAVAFGGCATASTPERVDPLAGLLPGAAAVPSDITHVSNARAKRLALIVSTGTEATLKHLEASMKEARQGYGNPLLRGDIRERDVANADPHYVVDAITLLLKSHFADVALVDDFRSFQARQLDVAAVVDVFVSTGAWMEGRTVVDLRLLLFDQRVRKIGEARGMAERNFWLQPATRADDNHIRELQKQALGQLATTLSHLLDRR